MLCKDLIHELTIRGDAKKAEKMAAYMRNQFVFLGVQSKLRREAAKDILKALVQLPEVDWAFVHCAWESPYREMQYCAGDYLKHIQKRLTSRDIPALQKLAQKKSWWDTVDFLDGIIGDIALRYPEVNGKMLAWSTHEDFWLRRIAINHQRHRKAETDTALLEIILCNNLNQEKFFINKAIGWALREYSKTDPEWVSRFIHRYKEDMAALSVREGSKYL